MDHQFLTTKEAAKIMRLSTKRICELCESGQIAAVRTGGTSGQWRIHRDRFMQGIGLTPDDPIPMLDDEQEEIDLGVFERARKAAKG